MAKFWRNRWDDIRGSLIWQILVWIFGGGLVTAIAQAIRSTRNLPFEWWFVVVVFLISALALAVVTLLAARKRTVQPQSPVQAGSILPHVQTPINFNAGEYIRLSYQSGLTADVEKNIRLLAAQNQPSDREAFLAQFIGIGVVAYLHDITWAYIFKSQILMLTELNRRSGIMPLPDAAPYYDVAKAANLSVYGAYSLTQWLDFMKAHQLLIQHPSNMLEITVRGKDFLKYLTHWGRSADERKY